MVALVKTVLCQKGGTLPFKAASVAVLKLTEHDVTLMSFVTDLSYPGISHFYIMCEIDAREGAESLALIFAIV